MPKEFTFKLAFEDFDVSLLGDEVEQGSDDFTSKVSEFVAKQFADFGGRARVIINDEMQEIEVHWTKEQNWKDPKDRILDLLNDGKLATALPMLWTLVQKDPTDADNLYDLGVVYSELRQLSKALATLEQLVELAPDHVHGLTALGVAEINAGNLLIAEEWLRKATRIDPKNQWALRNLGACLMKQDRYQDASRILSRCLAEAPKDIAAMVGLGEAQEALGDSSTADGLYRMAIQIGGPEHIVDIAKERRTRIAENRMRENPNVRLDVVEYIKTALGHFRAMQPKQIQDLGIEIGLLGTKGLSINDPTKTYKVKSIDGEFTGLQLVSIMYAAFQQFAPGQNVGVDFSKEYQFAADQLSNG
jgi:tetratricopeptide (TPR) repeat protein